MNGSGSGGIGVLGVGAYLPPETRTNEWWTPDVVARWSAARATAGASAPAAPTPAMELVLAAMRRQAADPFRGTVERRVMASDQTSLDMEATAAAAALARADVRPGDVDLLLAHTPVPEYLLSNPAAALHHRLGLPTACLALQVDGSAYSFLGQLALAEAMIASGRARVALLVQSSAASRLIDRDDPVSPMLGDAATAIVVGRVREGRGLFAAVHRADGRCPNSLVASVPGGRWYDGRAVLHVDDVAGERRLFLETVDHGAEAIAAALAAGRVDADQVDFFAVHQGTPWLRAITQERAGLARARTVDLFARTAYVFAASLPLVLATAESDGLLADGDRVVLFGGGTGITFGAAVLGWGR